MSQPNHKRVTSFYIDDEFLERLELARDELANGDIRRRPSRNSALVELLDRVLPKL